MDGNHGSIDDDDKTSIVLASRAIHSQEEEKQDVVVGNEREGTGSNECVIESNVKNKDKDLENKTKYFVHSSLLAVHSSYFRSLFYSGMKETPFKRSGYENSSVRIASSFNSNRSNIQGWEVLV